MPLVPAGTAVWAHRGARRQAPENTVAAFARAVTLGADGVELDVRRSRDDALLVHHDASARRVGILAEHAFAEIRAARPEIPTLDEALDACAGVLVNVEVKNFPGEADYDADDRVAALISETLDRRGHEDSVLVSSFNLAALDRFRGWAPDVPTGFLTLRGFDPRDAIGLAADRGHTAVHPDARGLRGTRADAFADAAHGRELRVHVWTVNDPDRIRHLAGAGVDAVITDVPDVARAALGR